MSTNTGKDVAAAAAIDVVIRFSTSNADLILPITDASRVSTLSLKQRIRSELPAPSNECKLRLIHSGRVLPDTAPLSKTLNITPAPPPPLSDKAKGKLPVKEVGPRIYIHCSIGDALSPHELAAEQKAAIDADTALQQSTSTLPQTASDEDNAATSTTTTPAPRGFDRLLSAGFNPSEVAALRAQFLAIQSHSHTPDNMPTGQALLALEERWLDNGSDQNSAAADGAGGFATDDSGGLEDMLYGNLIGFFWPVGAMCWLMREEGVWSRRRQIAVFSGFMVNLLFGGLKWIN